MMSSKQDSGSLSEGCAHHDVYVVPNSARTAKIRTFLNPGISTISVAMAPKMKVKSLQHHTHHVGWSVSSLIL